MNEWGFEPAEVHLVLMENSGLDAELVLLMRKSNHFLCCSANIMCVHQDPLGLSVVGITLILSNVALIVLGTGIC